MRLSSFSSTLASAWIGTGLCLSGLCGFPASTYALDVPPFTDRVVDLAGILQPQEKDQISNSLGQFQSEKGPQLAVLTIPSLEGEPIETYSIKVVNQWKLGDKKKSDGLLLLIAVKDHKARIEVGQGLEGDLPDILAGRIIRDTMAPYFRAERYRDGLVAGLQAIAVRLGGSLKEFPVVEMRRQRSSEAPSGLSWLFPLLIFAFLVLPRLFGSSQSSGSGRGFFTGMLLGGLLGGGRRGGGGLFGGGDGGGGFGGGGGGGFSGGGASGDW